MHRLAAVLAVSLFLLAPASTEARNFRVNQVPNGSKFGCALCHTNPEGGGSLNGFGSQVEGTLVGDDTAMAQVDWSAIFDQDGDADRYTNGRELGDPEGMWVIGMPNPPGDTYAPFDRADSPCGDGVLENPPEECDGAELPAEVTCETLGWGPGTLTCASTCRINAEQCQGFEIVVPNNDTPPPANNTNANTNNGTSNETTGETTGLTTGPSAEDEESGGCATATGSSPAPFLVLAAFAIRRRRRAPKDRVT